jgi:hypothetical protein
MVFGSKELGLRYTIKQNIYSFSRFRYIDDDALRMDVAQSALRNSPNDRSDSTFHHEHFARPHHVGS